MSENYLALIGDIIGSRNLENRKQVQRELEVVLDEINTRFSSCIKTEFIITLGDEFQGLLLPCSEAYRIATTVLEQMHPVELRFGLGYGSITTAMKESSIGMDGPAFYAARQALEFLKNSRDAAVRIAGPALPEIQLRAVNALLSSLAAIRQFWPENFKQALPLVRQGLTQQQVAAATNVTQSAISWMLKRARWREIQAIEAELIYLLRNLFAE